MSSKLRRREFLNFAGLGAALSLLASKTVSAQVSPSAEKVKPREHVTYPTYGTLPPMRASQDRIVKETVGLRPFRQTGPNLAVESLGEKTIVHNYGHGGAGWSLSWGTALEASQKALATGQTEFAVLGCGAVGMTTAVMLLRAGAKVTVYSKDRHPNVTSSMATGVWSPYSRICLEEHATPEFALWWTKTCRASFREYQNYLGLAGSPIEWVDSYSVSDKPWDELKEEREKRQEGPRFGRFSDYVKDLTPVPEDVESNAHPFSERYVRKGSRMIFNISAYVQTLLGEITRMGGRLVYREFHDVGEIAGLPEKTIVNATGLGAKALFGDDLMVPVRGQLTFLIPDPNVEYSFSNPDAYVIPRRDGLVVGASQNGKYGSTDLSVDPQQSFDAVAAIAKSMLAMKLG